jgi:hypothetical protein
MSKTWSLPRPRAPLLLLVRLRLHRTPMRDTHEGSTAASAREAESKHQRLGGAMLVHERL